MNEINVGIYELTTFLGIFFSFLSMIAIAATSPLNVINIKRWFYFFSLCVIWQALYLPLLTQYNSLFADYYSRLLVSILIQVPMVFCYAASGIGRLKMKMLTPLFGINTLSLILIWSSDWVIAGFQEAPYGFYPLAKPLFWTHIFFNLLAGLECAWLLWREFRQPADDLIRSTVKTYLITIILYSGCVLDYLPMFPSISSHFPFGPTSGIFISFSSFFIVTANLISLSSTLLIKNQESKKVFALELEKMKLERESALIKMKLLQSQLNPHFIFNSLNSIKQLVLKDVAEGRQMINKMSSLLRWILSKKETDVLELKEEVEAVRNYLDIEQIRLGEYLKINLDIDSGLLEQKVINFIIQPLVENAVKYGQRTSKDSLQVELSIQPHPNGMKIAVSNSGEWVVPGQNNSTGVGHENLISRLKNQYGENFSFEMKNLHGTVVGEIIIPLG